MCNVNVACKSVKIVEKNRPHTEIVTISISHHFIKKLRFQFANDNRDHTNHHVSFELRFVVNYIFLNFLGIAGSE